MFKVGAMIECSMVGATPTRNPDLSFKLTGPPALVDMPTRVKCYNKHNNRHTNRELLKYAIAGKSLFKESPPSLSPLCFRRSPLTCSFVVDPPLGLAGRLARSARVVV